jgi:hypothetical protein
VVGGGFDASDLRLGGFLPHEIYNVDVLTGRVKRTWLISQDQYVAERLKRSRRARAFAKYERYVNRTGRLLASLGWFLAGKEPASGKARRVPMEYEPAKPSVIAELVELLRIAQRSVLPQLPPSEAFAVSGSFVRRSGWIIWDIYGGWYRR